MVGKGNPYNKKYKRVCDKTPRKQSAKLRMEIGVPDFI